MLPKDRQKEGRPPRQMEQIQQNFVDVPVDLLEAEARLE